MSGPHRGLSAPEEPRDDLQRETKHHSFDWIIAIFARQRVHSAVRQAHVQCQCAERAPCYFP